MESVIRRLLALIDQSELNDKQILKELDLSSSMIADWRRKKSTNPSSNTIIKFANFFHVSTDYLLTGKINCDTISDEEKEWLALYRELISYDPTLVKECHRYIEGSIMGYQIGKETESNKTQS